MPKAALAAVVIVTRRTCSSRGFPEIRRVRSTEFRWAVIAFAG
jgi:hypothetical protein